MFLTILATIVAILLLFPGMGLGFMLGVGIIGLGNALARTTGVVIAIVIDIALFCLWLYVLASVLTFAIHGWVAVFQG